MVLYAVWYFNKNIPGLGLWTLSFLGASVACTSMVAREHLPEAAAVVLSQGCLSAVAYVCLLGVREYMGLPRWRHRWAVAAIVALLLVLSWFTVVSPRPDVRFALAGTIVGPCFLLNAHALARGGFREAPVRYLVAALMAGHGLFALMRPLLFRLAAPFVGGEEGHLLDLVPQLVLLEGALALVLIGFGALMLAHAHTTRELRQLAEVDALTGAYNRRAFLVLLDKALSGAHRMNRSLPVLVIDLDHFKRVNDSWGHHCGDAVLRHFAQLAASCLRNEDVIGRLGGEEFAIFLPQADAAGAALVAERLRALVEASPLKPSDAAAPAIPLTVSIGLAFCDPGRDAAGVLRRADEAMYQAKQRGRNRVAIAEASPDGDGALQPAKPATEPRALPSA